MLYKHLNLKRSSKQKRQRHIYTREKRRVSGVESTLLIFSNHFNSTVGTCHHIETTKTCRRCRVLGEATIDGRRFLTFDCAHLELWTSAGDTLYDLEHTEPLRGLVASYCTSRSALYIGAESFSDLHTAQALSLSIP